MIIIENNQSSIFQLEHNSNKKNMEYFFIVPNTDYLKHSIKLFKLINNNRPEMDNRPISYQIDTIIDNLPSSKVYRYFSNLKEIQEDFLFSDDRFNYSILDSIYITAISKKAKGIILKTPNKIRLSNEQIKTLKLKDDYIVYKLTNNGFVIFDFFYQNNIYKSKTNQQVIAYLVRQKQLKDSIKKESKYRKIIIGDYYSQFKNIEVEKIKFKGKTYWQHHLKNYESYPIIYKVLFKRIIKKGIESFEVYAVFNKKYGWIYESKYKEKFKENINYIDNFSFCGYDCNDYISFFQIKNKQKTKYTIYSNGDEIILKDEDLFTHEKLSNGEVYTYSKTNQMINGKIFDGVVIKIKTNQLKYNERKLAENCSFIMHPKLRLWIDSAFSGLEKIIIYEPIKKLNNSEYSNRESIFSTLIYENNYPKNENYNIWLQLLSKENLFEKYSFVYEDTCKYYKLNSSSATHYFTKNLNGLKIKERPLLKYYHIEDEVNGSRDFTPNGKLMYKNKDHYDSITKTGFVKKVILYKNNHYDSTYFEFKQNDTLKTYKGSFIKDFYGSPVYFHSSKNAFITKINFIENKKQYSEITLFVNGDTFSLKTIKYNQVKNLYSHNSFHGIGIFLEEEKRLEISNKIDELFYSKNKPFAYYHRDSNNLLKLMWSNYQNGNKYLEWQKTQICYLCDYRDSYVGNKYEKVKTNSYSHFYKTYYTNGKIMGFVKPINYDLYDIETKILDCNDSSYYFRESLEFDSFYNERGQITFDGNNGSVLFNDSKGIPIYEAHYKNGELDSIYKTYNMTGQLESIGLYKNGKKEGTWYYGNLESKYNWAQMCGASAEFINEFMEKNPYLKLRITTYKNDESINSYEIKFNIKK
jgi:hypothetical protein